MLDGLAGGHTGVMLLHDGRILGGDAFFYYLGAYSSSNGRWKGEFVNRRRDGTGQQRPVLADHAELDHHLVRWCHLHFRDD